ncbi:MAG: efflux RND transporter permease subunit, partial [Desulfovermiculus sp.]|nr:efflux RND transporter permease subunit [Desulfovermiculus sp.]
LAGVWSYWSMPRLEDPTFTIRRALVITTYPGAAPEKVENLVTDKLEDRIREMGEVETVTSQSMAGLSVIYVNVYEHLDDMQPIWQRLRNKVRDTIPNLPQGARRPVVNDEFGDVFGLLLSLSGEGYANSELKDMAEEVQDELLTMSTSWSSCPRAWSGPEPLIQAVHRLWLPLLSASLTTIFVFLPIPLAQSMTGEYTSSLFTVVTVTLLMSWFLAMSFVPLLSFFLRLTPKKQAQGRQPVISGWYARVLGACLHRPKLFVLGVIALMGLSAWGFTFVPSMFFPPNEREIVVIDFWQPYGVDIRATRDRLARLEQWVKEQKEVESAGSFVGYGLKRRSKPHFRTAGHLFASWSADLRWELRYRSGFPERTRTLCLPCGTGSSRT